MFRAIPAALLVIAGVVSSSMQDAATAPKPSRYPLVTVHAKEYAFVAPASIAAGTTTFRLVNDGKEPHQISIVKLDKGKTLADFVEAAKAQKPTPWAVGVGGPNAAGPGQTIDATLNLEAGSYLLLCWVPSPGTPVPHLMKGMIQPLAVTAPGGVAQAGAPKSYFTAAAPDVHLELSDYTFKFSKPLTAGKHTIHVMNTATQEHEAVMMKLAQGKSMKDVDAWFASGMQGPSPMAPLPGMAGLGRGRTATFTTTLTPGHYGLICYISDAKDGKPHFLHGMVQEFDVAAK